MRERLQKMQTVDSYDQIPEEIRSIHQTLIGLGVECSIKRRMPSMIPTIVLAKSGYQASSEAASPSVGELVAGSGEVQVELVGYQGSFRNKLLPRGSRRIREKILAAHRSQAADVDFLFWEEASPSMRIEMLTSLIASIRLPH